MLIPSQLIVARSMVQYCCGRSRSQMAIPEGVLLVSNERLIMNYERLLIILFHIHNNVIFYLFFLKNDYLKIVICNFFSFCIHNYREFLSKGFLHVHFSLKKRESVALCKNEEQSANLQFTKSS